MPLPPPDSLGPRPLSTQTPEFPNIGRELPVKVPWGSTRGGQVRIATHDPQALKAVHEFLGFQTQDHRTDIRARHDAIIETETVIARFGAAGSAAATELRMGGAPPSDAPMQAATEAHDLVSTKQPATDLWCALGQSLRMKWLNSDSLLLVWFRPQEEAMATGGVIELPDDVSG